MAAMRVISADSHVIEPGDLWTQRLDHNIAIRRRGWERIR